MVLVTRGLSNTEIAGRLVSSWQVGNALTVGESTAAALSQAPGVRDVADLQRAAGTLGAFIIGALRREVTERRTARSTGTDEAAWQASLGPYLTRQLETGKYPTIAPGSSSTAPTSKPRRISIAT